MTVRCSRLMDGRWWTCAYFWFAIPMHGFLEDLPRRRKRCSFYSESVILLEHWISLVRNQCFPRWCLSIVIFLPSWVAHWKSEIIHWVRAASGWFNHAYRYIRHFRTVRPIRDILRKTRFRSVFWLLLVIGLNVDDLTVRNFMRVKNKQTRRILPFVSFAHLDAHVMSRCRGRFLQESGVVK